MASQNPPAPLPEPDLASTHLREIPSPFMDREHSAASRIDPFWHAMAVGSLVASWEGREHVERMNEAGGHPAAVRDMADPAGLAREKVRRRSPVGMDSLAAIAMWRTVTTEQLAALAGWVGLTPLTERRSTAWSSIPRPVRRLWSADLADRGQIASSQPELPVLWRPSARFDAQRWVDCLDYVDWLKLTAGTEWRPGARGGDLHNVLTTELGLRISEFTDAATVVGEMVCGFDQLDPDRWAGKATGGVSPSGDMIAVRRDGMRVVIEMTVHQSKISIGKKVRSWVKMLCSEEFEKSGLTVCFVEAMPPETTGNEVSGSLRSQIVAELKQFPEATYFRVRDRISIARWRWWFPSAHTAAPGFAGLLAFRPTGEGENLWEPVELLDPSQLPFTADDPARSMAIIHNSRFMSGVPRHIRDGLNFEFGPVDLSHLALEEMGMLELYQSLAG